MSTRTECTRPTDAEIRDVLDQVVQFLGNLQAGPEAFGGPATLCDFSLWLRTMESHGERVKERAGLLAERMTAERSEAPVTDEPSQDQVDAELFRHVESLADKGEETRRVAYVRLVPQMVEAWKRARRLADLGTEVAR